MDWIAAVVPLALASVLLAGCTDGPPPEPTERIDPAVIDLASQDLHAGWSCDPCRATFSTGGFVWEPHILADPADPDRIVAFAGDGGGIVFYSTTDGGSSWERHRHAIGPGDGEGRRAQWTGWGDPALAFDGDRLYAVGLGNTYAGSSGVGATHRDVWISEVHDLGAGLGEPVIITQTESPQLFTGLPAYAPFATPDREFVAVGPDEMMVTWVLIRSDGGVGVEYDLQATRSSDGGMTWSEPEDVFLGASPKGPYPFYVDGSAMVAFSVYSETGLHVAAQGDGWQTEVLGPSFLAPHVAVQGGRAAVATAGLDDDGEQRAVLYVYDGGAWSGPLWAGQAVGAVDHVSVAFAGDEIWLAWYDEHDAADLHISRFDDDGYRGEILVDQGLDTPTARYGDYIFGLNGRPDGASVTYVAGDAEGRWLRHSLVHMPAS